MQSGLHLRRHLEVFASGWQSPLLRADRQRSWSLSTAALSRNGLEFVLEQASPVPPTGFAADHLRQETDL